MDFSRYKDNGPKQLFVVSGRVTTPEDYNRRREQVMDALGVLRFGYMQGFDTYTRQEDGSYKQDCHK